MSTSTGALFRKKTVLSIPSETLVVKVSQFRYVFRNLKLRHACVDRFNRNSTEQKTLERRKLLHLKYQKLKPSRITMCCLFPAAWYSHVRWPRGRILRGWLGGRTRGWAHFFVNLRLIKVTCNIFCFTKFAFGDSFFFLMDFALSAATVLFEVAYSFVWIVSMILLNVIKHIYCTHVNSSWPCISGKKPARF